MRFLIGIFTGAVVTLLVATAMDAPTHPILNNAKDLASDGWNGLISATSSSLFESAETPVEEKARGVETNADPSPTPPVDAQRIEPESASVEASRQSDPGGPFVEEDPAFYAALEPIPALPPPDPVDVSPSLEAWAEAALAATREDHANLPVWVPFHSQRSAQGFATRLSQAVDHEFRVVRQGAGAYQVVFDATDADERAMVLAQVTEITGR